MNNRKYKIVKNKLAIKAVDLLGITLEFSFGFARFCVQQLFAYS